MSKFKPGRRENPMVTKSDVTAFRNEDFEVEYRGFKSDWLDSIGAIRKIAKKEELEEEEGE
ncbi:MAG: hypothetical protein LLG04_18935 [Parachlamydia sp.]|nr:hypothetical protein [Parachlamydia sp.]